eukprot:5540087-Prymnesium_polylepis.1
MVKKSLISRVCRVSRSQRSVQTNISAGATGGAPFTQSANMAAELPKTSLLQAAAPAEAAPAPQAIEREPPRPMCATDDEALAWAEEWHAQYVPSAHDASLDHD